MSGAGNKGADGTLLTVHRHLTHQVSRSNQCGVNFLTKRSTRALRMDSLWNLLTTALTLAHELRAQYTTTVLL